MSVPDCPLNPELVKLMRESHWVNRMAAREGVIKRSIELHEVVKAPRLEDADDPEEVCGEIGICLCRYEAYVPTIELITSTIGELFAKTGLMYKVTWPFRFLLLFC